MSKPKHPEKQLEEHVRIIVAGAILIYDKSKSDHVYLFDVDDISGIVKKITAGIVEALS